MHTIRVKEKKGRIWEEVKKLEVNKESARHQFIMNVGGYCISHSPVPRSITWSEGKKVHGTFRIN